MEPNKASNNLPDDIDVVVIIDKEKLPDDIRKILEENLPKDVQEKVFEVLQKGKMGDILPQKDKSTDKKEQVRPSEDKPDIDNKLFAIQTGTVVGNIYADGTYKREEDIYKKKKDATSEEA